MSVNERRIARSDQGAIDHTGSTARPVFVAAWVLALVFYFMQYALRSAPGVMVHELRDAFGVTPLGLTSLLGLYFYTYAGFAIIAGASLDRYGAKIGHELTLKEFQTADWAWIGAVVASLVLMPFLRETGSAANSPKLQRRAERSEAAGRGPYG